MRVALTGVTSFTGCHIARALVQTGHQVLALMTRPQGAYSNDLMASRRLSYASGEGSIQKTFEAPFGSQAFVDAISDFGPDVLINHGADIKGYRSPDFDVDRSVNSSLNNLSYVLGALKKAGSKGVLHSGSVFEPIDSLPELSPYGKSKFLVSETLKNECKHFGLEFSKVYIANPVGPYENEDRLIPVFVQKWLSSQKPHLSAPTLVWDNVPAPWLASVYVNESLRLASGLGGQIRRPSGFCEPLEIFVKRFCDYARQEGVTLDLGYTSSAPEPQKMPPRLNTEPCAELSSQKSVDDFFSVWVRSLFFEGSK